MAIQHLVTFTWRDGTTARDVAELERALRDLVGTFGGIESCDIGVPRTLVASRSAPESRMQFEGAGPTPAAPHHRPVVEADDFGPAQWRAAVLSTVQVNS
ncbi:hypothetical protein [Blastococcus xanthinilyticus]|uniref:Uncharacterized protein n=1 Tax=Blastococcus xanthinilyticus TaxID=1564164 RepID=A0A5S5D5A6_9ACTN|nr:hypothetical protein [Blastococcus xanthinilyticus]TYP90478.1 hypothetical protein BD833_101196 [Blastococcus xanthinilyticus]